LVDLVSREFRVESASEPCVPVWEAIVRLGLIAEESIVIDSIERRLDLSFFGAGLVEPSSFLRVDMLKRNFRLEHDMKVIKDVLDVLVDNWI